MGSIRRIFGASKARDFAVILCPAGIERSTDSSQGMRRAWRALAESWVREVAIFPRASWFGAWRGGLAKALVFVLPMGFRGFDAFIEAGKKSIVEMLPTLFFRNVMRQWFAVTESSRIFARLRNAEF